MRSIFRRADGTSGARIRRSDSFLLGAKPQRESGSHSRQTESDAVAGGQTRSLPRQMRGVLRHTARDDEDHRRGRARRRV